MRGTLMALSAARQMLGTKYGSLPYDFLWSEANKLRIRCSPGQQVGDMS